MKKPRYLLLILVALTSSLGAYSLEPGERFPELSFSTLGSKKEQTVSELTEQKLMLHLFASW